MFNSDLEQPDVFQHLPKLPCMSGQEIADEMGLNSRMHVSAIIHRGMGNVYKHFRRTTRMTPWQIALHIFQLFGVNQRPASEWDKFVKLFPNSRPDYIRNQIIEDGRNQGK